MSRRTLRHRAALTALTAGAALALAPSALATFPGDNGLIAFSRDGDIWTIHPDGTGEKRLTSGAEHVDVAPEWTPDGNEIYFERTGNDGPHIYRMRADGTGVTWVRRGELPQVSGDGTRIAFIADDTETSRPAVYTAARDGSGAKVLHADDNLTSVDDWAPNHDLVLFTERDGDSLFLAGSAAGVQAGFGFLHDDRHFHNDGPSWSPDGAHIAFATRASGISGCDDTGDPTCGGDPDVGIRTMDLGGGGLRVVHPGYATQPVWSPDGAKLALNIDGKIYVIDSQGGGKRVLTTGSGADWQPVKRVEIPWDPPVPPSPPEPETRTVTVTVQAPPPPPVVVEKVVTRVVTTAGKVCPIPKGKRRLTLTIRAKRAIKKGASVKVWLDVSSGRVNVPKGRPVRVTAR